MSSGAPNAGEGRSVVERGNRPLGVVMAQPEYERLGALVRHAIWAGVGPLGRQRLDEAFRFAVGARRIGPREATFQSQLLAGGGEVLREVDSCRCR